MNNFWKKVGNWFNRYKPELFIAGGISSLIFSSIWNIKATVKATKIVEKKKKELGVEKLPTKEVIKLTWKCYIPGMAGTVAGVTGCIIGNNINNNRNALLITAYSTAETGRQIAEAVYNDFREETVKAIGKEKTQEIEDKVVEKQQNKGNQVAFITGDGEYLFMDELTGRYFKSNKNKILRAANILNANALSGMSGQITLSEWYEEIGLDQTAQSDEIGWMIGCNGEHDLIEIVFNYTDSPTGEPCCIVKYANRPVNLY